MQFRFADHVFDAARRELRRGGEPVAVEPQVFDMLEYLLRNRDRVVTKDDLLDSVWGGRIVSESTLNSRMNAVRRAVGDRLDPLHPPLWDFYIGRALLHVGRYEEALSWFEVYSRRTPSTPNWRSYRAAALAQLGRDDEARAALPDPTLPQTDASIGEIRRLESYLKTAEFDRFVEGLRKAGLPE